MIFSYCNTVVRVLKMAEGYFKTLPENWGEDREKKKDRNNNNNKKKTSLKLFYWKFQWVISAEL